MPHILDQLIPLNKIDQLYYQALMALFAAGLTGLAISMLGLALKGTLRRAGTWLKKSMPRAKAKMRWRIAVPAL